jgi:hypothetical protein
MIQGESAVVGKLDDQIGECVFCLGVPRQGFLSWQPPIMAVISYAVLVIL